MIRYAVLDDLIDIREIIKDNINELGFVLDVILKKSILKNEVIIFKEDNMLKGFINFHINKRGFATIYEIAVKKEFRNNKIGKKLFQYLQQKTPIQLKVKNDIPANMFYTKMGGVVVSSEKSKKSTLNIYQFDKL